MTDKEPIIDATEQLHQPETKQKSSEKQPLLERTTRPRHLDDEVPDTAFPKTLTTELTVKKPKKPGFVVFLTAARTASVLSAICLAGQSVVCFLVAFKTKTFTFSVLRQYVLAIVNIAYSCLLAISAAMSPTSPCKKSLQKGMDFVCAPWKVVVFVAYFTIATAPEVLFAKGDDVVLVQSIFLVVNAALLVFILLFGLMKNCGYDIVKQHYKGGDNFVFTI